MIKSNNKYNIVIKNKYGTQKIKKYTFKGWKKLLKDIKINFDEELEVLFYDNILIDDYEIKGIFVDKSLFEIKNRYKKIYYDLNYNRYKIEI
jgi:hypothetical protein